MWINGTIGFKDEFKLNLRHSTTVALIQMVNGTLLKMNFLSLGSYRLAILDLSESGNQPLTADNERYIFVYNGEIFNFIELRSSESLGHVLRLKQIPKYF